ncbi:MAG TPA: FAD-binding and (Fe-S)-binding domain-containing protein [Saprospiraceae bacterium]|nr:FAD-binding and (Fe-S)-binding domain-containing protein [Saprospiraceae bacterium]
MENEHPLTSAPVLTETSVQTLRNRIAGSFHLDNIHKSLYATDASVYKEVPLGVVFPKHETDLVSINTWAQENEIPLIPRAGGTSLAGQVVGDGLVVDCSKHMTSIVEFNKEEKWIIVEPGVIRDDLNAWLRKYHLFFGPNTSTSNRCTIGGMVGNNSSGTTSIKYGVTRDHVLELWGVLPGGEKCHFHKLEAKDFQAAARSNQPEAPIYKAIQTLSQEQKLKEAIAEEYPKKSIHRRNTGYALDSLMNQYPFDSGASGLNLCPLLCGSEGTLMMLSRIKLRLHPLPPSEVALLCLHFDSLSQSLKGTVVAMKEALYACELMDQFIMDAAAQNRRQRKNSFFIEGHPKAVLCLEIRKNKAALLDDEIVRLLQQLPGSTGAYHISVVRGEKVKRVWEYRKAGLGVLSNIPGEAKPVACVEDTAVDLNDLPAFVKEMQGIFHSHQQQAVFYAHAGAGELHVRPILNLKTPKDRVAFKEITREVAILTKKYQGSFSGEHGDGRVRAAFLDILYGPIVLSAFRKIKTSFDPNYLMNPGKILDPKDILEDLRHIPMETEKLGDTMYDFGPDGYLGMVERCNGSGDCRKSPERYGAMCPSYHATREEKDSTRGRANTLRNFIELGLANESSWNQSEIREVLDLCLSCKACTSECPSNVNMTLLKSEYLHHYYASHKRPIRDYLFAFNYQLLGRLQGLSPLINFALNRMPGHGWIKKILGIATERSMPELKANKGFSDYSGDSTQDKSLAIFADEFTRLYQPELLEKFLRLLDLLGYSFELVRSTESGRAAMSKGFLDYAKGCAEKNVDVFYPHVLEGKTIVGLEPSAVLSFREEYPKLVKKELVDQANMVSENTFCFEEWLFREIQSGNITTNQFDTNNRNIFYHSHCHQKALSQTEEALLALSLPDGHTVREIPSGCCGMAGAFGYEQEHFAVSEQIAHLKLVPFIRKIPEDSHIVSSGFSCKHQIADFADKKIWHPAELMLESIKKEMPLG